MKVQGFTTLGGLAARVAAAMIVLASLLAALPATTASAMLPMSLATIGVSSQNGSLTYGTSGTATYTITLTAGNGPNADLPATELSISGLPAGASGLFSPNPTYPCTGNQCQVTSTLTVTSDGTTAAVTARSFTVATVPASVTGSGSLTVGKRALTVTASTDSKVYDGTVSSAALPTITLGGLVNGDSAVWSQTFDIRNAGIAKTLTPIGTISDGTGGNNYSVSYVADHTGVISPQPLTVTASASSKTYDGTNTSAALPTITSGALHGTDSAVWTQTYDNKNAGTGKTLTPTGTVTDGNGGKNYTVTFAQNTTGTILTRAITVTAATSSKPYDGTNASTGVPTITSGGLQGTDTAVWSQTFDNKNVGTNKTLTPAGTVTDGNSGNNYAVTLSPSTTGTITARPLTVSGITVNTKIYDGTTTATLNTAGASLAGVMGTEQVSVNAASASALFVDRNAGTGKAVSVTGLSLSGTDAPNYSLTPPAGLTGVISQRPITVTATTDSKAYDGTNTSTAVPTITAGALQDADSATWTQTFNNENVGAGNKVLTPAGTVSDGNFGNNYLVTPVTVSNGTITARPITVTAVSTTRNYDGTINSAGIPTLTLGTLATGDSVIWTQTYDTKAVGTAKVISPVGTVSDGNGGANYAVTRITATGIINTATLTITGVTAASRAYDGSTTATLTGTPVLSGVFSPDQVTLGNTPVASFGDKNVATGKPVTVTGYTIGGTDWGNYTLTQPAGLTANITPKPLTITGLTAANKEYDGLTTATLTGTAVITGVVSPDVVTFGGTPLATFADKKVGTVKPVTVTGYTLAGTDAPNYSLPAQPTGLTAAITAKPLSVASGVTAISRAYNATRTATFAIASPTFTGLIQGDIITLITGTGTFADKNAGTAKVVTATGFTLTGIDAANYTLAQPGTVTPPGPLTADITPFGLTVTATASNKIYDGTRNATVTLASNKFAADALTINKASALFADKNVGNGKTVTVTGLSLSGTNAPNYTVVNVNATTTATANITPASLTVTANDASKVVGTELTFNGTEFTTSPMMPGDMASAVTLTSDGQAADAVVGAYDIVPTDAWGTGIGNYTIDYKNGTLTVTAAAPVFTPSATSANYGLVKLKTTSSGIAFKVTNSGGSDLQFGSVALAGSNLNQFTLTANTCSGATVAPGASCSVTAAFKPTIAGAKTAFIRFYDNAPNSPQLISLFGKGARELVINGGFNLYPSTTARIPSSWAATRFVSTDGKSPTIKQEGTASIRIGNTSAITKTLMQTSAVTGGVARSTLRLSLWAKGQAIPTTAGLVRVQVQLYYGSTLVQTNRIDFPAGIYIFKNKQLTYTALKAYNKVVITLTYSKASGAVWFDNLSLLQSP